MFGFGTILNTVAVILGGIIGSLVGRFFKESFQKQMIIVCGVSTMFLGVAGAMEEMLSIEGATISSGRSMFVVLSLVIGTAIGELIDIEKWFDRFGEWLKRKTGNANDNRFVDAFVTASLTVCIGAMAVIGSIQDGLLGDWSILATKSILDLVIIIVMTCSMGKGCGFSAILIFLMEGTMTLSASLLKQAMTPDAISNLSLVGSILIFCVGLNLVFGKKVRTANLLPSLILAVGFAFLPFSIG